MCKILDQEEVKPHKVRYYLEQRDPDFAEKMAEVLCVYRQVWMVVRIRAKMAQRKKLAWPLRSSQLLLAVERLVANDGWVTSRVKAVSRRRRGPQARLYRACHPAILDHRGRRLTPATLLPPPSMRGFTPPVTPGENPQAGGGRVEEEKAERRGGDHLLRREAGYPGDRDNGPGFAARTGRPCDLRT